MLERSNKTVIADYFQFLCVLQNVVRIPKNLISYKPEYWTNTVPGKGPIWKINRHSNVLNLFMEFERSYKKLAKMDRALKST